MLAEQRDAPLVVVEARRARDQLRDATGELAPRCPMLVHQLEALVVRQGEPVGAVAAALRHRVEAPRRFVGRWELRIEPRREHLGRHPLGVLADLGQRDVGVDDVEPGRLDRALQRAQPTQIRPERHQCRVRFVAEHRDAHDLVVGGLASLDRGDDAFAVEPRVRLAEQVQDTPPGGGGDGVSHDPKASTRAAAPTGAASAGDRRCRCDLRQRARGART